MAGAGGWDFSSMIIKAADNMNRGVENATKSGEGANGNDYQIEKGSSGEGDVSGKGTGVQPVQTTSQDMSSANNAAGNMQSLGNMGQDLMKSKMDSDSTTDESQKDESQEETSDERLKRIFKGNEDAVKCFSKIDSILFEYNNKAKKVHPDGENNVDDDVHYGVKAQDLEKNPLTESVVSEDDAGFKQVNSAELTMANTSMLAEVCRRLLAIEKALGMEIK